MSTAPRICLLAAALLLATRAPAPCADAAPLNFTPDPLGQTLQQHLIWTAPDAKPASAFVAFRRKFTLGAPPSSATLSIFADVRYLLWINGRYVNRGPCRFVPSGPEYDSLGVAANLTAGDNEIAVLVLARQSNGKMMLHAPGLTVHLVATGADGNATSLDTDASWQWSDRTRYRTPHVSWPNVTDVIDSTREDGDWTQPAYDDATWAHAATIPGSAWGPLTARRIPLLRDSAIGFALDGGATLPLTLSGGQHADFHLPKLVQAFTVLDFDATPGAWFTLPYAGITVTAKGGREVYVSSDTHAVFEGAVAVTSGTITLHAFELHELLYPFDCAGEFTCSDPFLNHLWAVSTRSLQILSEDAYIDCADRERVEWMDCDPPAYDVTSVAMAGPGDPGKPRYADPRLLGEMLRRTALTLQPGGWVKAHTCSDRFDIHAKMEDRACDWIEGARRYYESTGDASLIREIWPAVRAQLDYFLQRRSPRGLVIAREWVVWGNPMGYQTGEGTGLNVFVDKALVDGAFLAKIIGQADDAMRFDAAARELNHAINTTLWDEKHGTYFSGYATDPAELPPGTIPRPLKLAVTDHLIAPTIYPALFALDQGIVPPDRQARVTSYLMADPAPNVRLMGDYYYFKQLYALDEPTRDQAVLDTMRAKWPGMVNSPWQTTWEEFGGGSKAHCYGMYPAYFLSAYVLGVRRDQPASARHLLIDPRLGDLTSAKGIVVTEFGPVPVVWNATPHQVAFSFRVPDGVTATLRLRAAQSPYQLTLDGRTTNSTTPAIKLNLTAGAHQGTLTF